MLMLGSIFFFLLPSKRNPARDVDVQPIDIDIDIDMISETLAFFVEKWFFLRVTLQEA